MFKVFLRLKTRHVLMAIIGITLIDTFMMQNYVLTREAYFTLYAEELDTYHMEEMITMIKNMSLWGYVLAPLFVFLQLAVTSLLIQLPLVFNFIDIPFAKIFRAVTIAYLVILAVAITKLVYLLHIPAYELTEYTLAFIPLSITALIQTDAYPQHILSFLGNFNLFNLCWILALTFLLAAMTNIKKSTAALVVSSVWVFGLVFQFILFNYLNRVYA